MKRLLVFLVPLAMAIGAIYLLNCCEVYVGNVVGQVQVSTPYRYGSSGPYRYVNIFYEYKTFDGRMYSDELTDKDKYFLVNTFKGQQLKKGKVYRRSDLVTVIGVIMAIISAGGFLSLIIHWCCFTDSGYKYRTPKEEFGCRRCSSRKYCYFINTQCNFSINPIKSFFGY